MRCAPVIVLLVSSSCGRCDHDQRAPSVRVDPIASVGPSATPRASASAAQVPPAPAEVDAGCISPHDDALARYALFCANDDNSHCGPLDAGGDPIGSGQTVKDLDGDGVDEIQWGWGPPPVNSENHVYRGGIACAAHIIALGGNASLTRQRMRHESWADFISDDTSGCEGMCTCVAEKSYYLRIDGGYVEDAKRRVPGVYRPCTPNGAP